MKTEQEDSSTSQNKIPNGTVEANNNNHNNNDNKIRNNLEENGSTVTCGTTIQDFYAGQSVFITGGTGFVGKILVEKLLRSCPEISMIYLLVRNKKGKSMEDRIEELFNNSFYDRLREMSPKFRHKIVGIKGNCSVRGLGISSTDREHLLREEIRTSKARPARELSFRDYIPGHCVCKINRIERSSMLYHLFS